MTRHYNLKNIRTLLTEGFTSDELRRLCFDVSDFRIVYDALTQDTGKAKMVDRLLEYAERKLLLETLLAHARQHNPARYEQHQPYYDLTQHRFQTPASVSEQRRIRILFLAANPSGTTRLRLDAEIRDIDQAIRQAEHRDTFDIQQHWAVRVTDLQGHLLRHEPDIVHFSGHGSQSNEIIFEDSFGSSQPVSVSALSGLFSLLQDNIRCVVLNACFSERQARAIANHIDCVIGMSREIGDSAAISFAAAFYQALGYGRDVKSAFDLGCLQIDLQNLDEQDVPKLIALRTNPQEIVFVHRD